MFISYLLQLMPAFRGKIRIGCFVMKMAFNLKTSRVLPLANGLKFSVPGLADSIAYQLFINGVYHKSLVNYLTSHIPQGGVFIDVGANIGCISIFTAIKRLDVKLYAFEASPHIFNHLKKNIAANKINNIECINLAVHHTDDLILDFYAPADQFGKGSFSNTYTNESEKVATIRLDTFLSQNNIIPDIIKIDVQGFELYVLEGLSNYLSVADKKPVIIFEFENWAEEIALGKKNIGRARQLITELGYDVFEFDRINNKDGEGQKKIDARQLIAFYRKGEMANETWIGNGK